MEGNEIKHQVAGDRDGTYLEPLLLLLLLPSFRRVEVAWDVSG